MASPVGRGSSGVPASINLPTTYKSVKSLSRRDLIALCSTFGINVKNVSRDALDISLCDCLCISTTGSSDIDNVETNKRPRVDDHGLDQLELSEYQHISPSYVFSLDGWTTDLSLFPELDIGFVKK